MCEAKTWAGPFVPEIPDPEIYNGWGRLRVLKLGQPVDWEQYVTTFARGALGEALWFESDPDENGVGGHEWESVEHLTVEDIVSDEDRRHWVDMCRAFVERNKQHLMTIDPEEAGHMYWMSKRRYLGMQQRTFLEGGESHIPDASRQVLHDDAVAGEVGKLFLRVVFE
ncbi:hypothetical protein [Streptomyces sp. BH105]|uniref:hypothetical protein n=1 Tax=Streptomyces sp. BH105 TaxID=3410408 RepID=UPI003CF4C5DE